MHCFSCSGVDVPESVLKAVTMRYSDREGHVRFDDFVSCYIKLKSMMSEFSFILASVGITQTFNRDHFLSRIANIDSSDADFQSSKGIRELQK